ncbi:MAG: hypothetical protein HYU99_08095, partial [Deltaproteobacteria bacterium]|nr:hypothetical protein [Deltaproteobacteria bacterium]
MSKLLAEEELDRNYYEQYVKKNRVFILGAGFSVAAGVPLTASLLDKTMKKFSAECPGIFSRVDGYAKESAENIDGEVDVEIYHTPALLKYGTWSHYSPLGEVEPFLVLPGYGKAFDVRSNAVL